MILKPKTQLKSQKTERKTQTKSNRISVFRKNFDLYLFFMTLHKYF